MSAPRLVILAAGGGTRMRREREGVRLSPDQREMADRGLKPLIPFGGEPFLSYSLTEIANAGYREVCLVVGPGEDPIRAFYEKAGTDRLTLSFAVQDRPEGGARALLAAEPFAEGGEVVVLNADDLYPAVALEKLREVDGSGLVGFGAETLVERGNVPPERIAAYALLTVDAGGYLDEVVEKPTPEQRRRLGKRVWVSKTCWRFRPVIFKACRAVARSSRGEYELSDAVALARHELGEKFRVLSSEAPVFDLSHREDVDTMAERLRDRTVRL